MRIYMGFVAALTACTGSIASDPGGGSGDDDGLPPPPPGNVQIVVRDGSAPQAGVRVIFTNTDGTQVTQTTDVTGLATAPMPTGGSLTVIRTFPTPPAPAEPIPPEIYSYVGVKTGDQLQLGHDIDDTGTPAAINVKVPTAAQGTVSIVTSCGSGQGTGPLVPLTVTGCPANVKFYVTDGNQESVVALAAYSSNVDLSLQPLSQALSTTISASDLSPDMSAVNVETKVMDGTYALYTSTERRVDQTSATVDMPTLSNVDELVVATITGTDGTQMTASREAYTVGPTVVDASANLIPYVSKTTVSPTQITWLETGTGSADFVLVTLDVKPQPQNNIAPPVAEYKRAIIAPHGGTSLNVPLLTGADEIYNPLTTDQIAGLQALGKATGGYDAARVYAFSVSSMIDAAPMSGAITLSYAGNTAPQL